MRGAGFDGREHIEVLPDLDEFTLADLAHQDDWQLELCAHGRSAGRRWPLFGDHRGMHILPAEFRPLGIGEDVYGFDAEPLRLIPRGYGACGQLLDLVASAEPFAGRHYHPLAVWSEEVDDALDVGRGHCVRERPDEVGIVLNRPGRFER